MQVIKADILGFCFGVRRAVEYAQKSLSDNIDAGSSSKVYSLGPLIHNEITLKKLENQGLIILEEDNLDAVEENTTVIIRAHGVSPDVIKALEEKHCKIINATCPRVNANQKMVEKYSNEGKTIILTGDSNHGEVKGIAGYAKGNFILLESEADADKLKNTNSDNAGAILLSQTTFSPTQFSNISKIIENKYSNLKIHNTICPATKERQDAVIDLCSKVEGVLVIGGKNSANTIRLFQTAQKHCKYSAHIQSADDIPEEFFKLKVVGLTAGASTPDEIINQIEDKLINS